MFDFSAVRVLVVGDVMLDRYWHGATNRISPEAPVPVIKMSDTEDRPGGAANVALNIASLGAKATLIGVVGPDAAAESLRNTLDKHQISAQFIETDMPTATKLRVMSRHQQLIRLDVEEAIPNGVEKRVEKALIEALPAADVVVFSDYAKGTLSNVESLIEICRKSHKKTIVDPKGDDFSRYQNATMITPNWPEFLAVTESDFHDKTRENREAAINAAGMALREKLSLESLLITRGDEGMSLITHDKNHRLHTAAQEVFDVTGAGDTVIATLAVGLVHYGSVEKAVHLSNEAAGVVVGKLGTATVTPYELLSLKRLRDLENPTLMSLEELQPIVKAAQASGEKVVFTNGCFDILHAGHVSYLQAAKQCGDRLVVAINSDASVRELKGESRPFNTLTDRALVLSALKDVDWVVEFNDATPKALIEALLPDVLVKGADYKIDEIVGSDVVRKNGGEVKTMPLKAGLSTTALAEKISEAIDQS